MGAVRLPLAASAGAAAAAALAAGHAVAVTPASARLALAVAGAAVCVALAAAGVAGSAALAGWAVVGLAAVYATALGLHDRGDGFAPLEAALVLLAWELGQWACELHAPGEADPAWLRDRLAVLAAGALAAAGIGWLALAPGGSERGGGLALTGAGVAAAVGALALAARLARR